MRGSCLTSGHGAGAGAAYSGPPLFRAGPLSSSVPSPPAVAAAGGYATEDFEKENASLRERLLKLEEELARAKEARSDNLRHGTKDAPGKLWTSGFCLVQAPACTGNLEPEICTWSYPPDPVYTHTQMYTAQVCVFVFVYCSVCWTVSRRVLFCCACAHTALRI